LFGGVFVAETQNKAWKTSRSGNRPSQALKSLSLAYNEFFRPEPGLYIAYQRLLFWLGLTFLKA